MSDLKSVRVLLADQDRPIKILLERRIPDFGPLVLSIRSGEEARELLAQEPFDISHLGFEVPGIGRIETRRLQRDGDESDVLLIESEAVPPGTGDLSISMQAGQSEDQFLTKPMRSRDLQRIVHEIRQEGSGSPRVGRANQESILGNSQAMRSVLDIVARVAAGQASVLIHGETGTGKTLVARRMHDLSPRAENRFVAINCSAFQDQLLESELFGYEKGAFTGAVTAKPGLFAMADKGTLFLDEVGDMSSAMQAKLLQVLDDGEFRRVGGSSSTKVDVRIIAASNKNLAQEVKAGRFREDLLFRLNVIHLRIPPLRERTEDIRILIEHFLDRYRLPGRSRKQVSPEATQMLSHYAWPGNVRELANTIEGLTLLAPGDEIRAEDLPPTLRPRTKLDLNSSDTPLPLKEVERIHIERTLRYTEGKKAPAARLLGIDVKTLGSKIKSYDIQI